MGIYNNGQLKISGDLSLIAPLVNLKQGVVEQEVTINGIDFGVIEHSVSYPNVWGAREVEMYLVKVERISKEQLAAEKSVKDAQQALDSAKDVLNKLKEGV